MVRLSLLLIHLSTVRTDPFFVATCLLGVNLEHQNNLKTKIRLDNFYKKQIFQHAENEKNTFITILTNNEWYEKQIMHDIDTLKDLCYVNK